MGSVCCIAARDRTLPSVTGGGALQRNSACSPPWSFRRDNRRRVADEVEGSPYEISYLGSRNISMDKMSLGSETGTLSEGASPLRNLGTPASQKSAPHLEMDANLMMPLPSDMPLASHASTEVKNIPDSRDVANTSIPKSTFSIPMLSTPVREPSFTNSRLLPPKSTPSRRARRSPGHQLFRQVSDSQILGLRSPSKNYSASEGRSSFVLSKSSNEFASGSNCASSDGGWSMNAFSELVASSQRGRWSFDSEHIGSGRRKISECSSRFSYSPSVDHQTCGACSKLLTERSSWSSQRIIANYELPVVSILACGHVYHSECLETMTTETEKYDPACPICTVGEKRVSKMSRKALKAEAELRAKHYKKYKNRVVDSYLDDDCDDLVSQKCGKREGKAIKMDPGSSARIPSSKPFLRRHFSSFGSKWSKPLSKDSVLKKSFWSRYRKD